jgi:hypothetical protein
MSGKLGQEPAYPIIVEDYTVDSDGKRTDAYNQIESGMSKRFYAACAAMQGILASWSRDDMPTTTGIKLCVSTAYELADELLKQENL